VGLINLTLILQKSSCGTKFSQKRISCRHGCLSKLLVEAIFTTGVLGIILRIVHFFDILLGNFGGGGLLVADILLGGLVVHANERGVSTNGLALIDLGHLGNPTAWDQLEQSVDEENSGSTHDGDSEMAASLVV